MWLLLKRRQCVRLRFFGDKGDKGQAVAIHSDEVEVQGLIKRGLQTPALETAQSARCKLPRAQRLQHLFKGNRQSKGDDLQVSSGRATKRWSATATNGRRQSRASAIVAIAVASYNHALDFAHPFRWRPTRPVVSDVLPTMRKVATEVWQRSEEGAKAWCAHLQLTIGRGVIPICALSRSRSYTSMPSVCLRPKCCGVGACDSLIQARTKHHH